MVSTTSHWGWSFNQLVILSPRLSRSGAMVAENTFTPLNGLGSPSLFTLLLVLTLICRDPDSLCRPRGRFSRYLPVADCRSPGLADRYSLMICFTSSSLRIRSPDLA